MALQAGMVNATVYKALALDRRQGTAFLGLVTEHSQHLASHWERLEAVARKDVSDQCLLATPSAAAVIHELLAAQEAVNLYERAASIKLPTSACPAIPPRPLPARPPLFHMRPLVCVNVGAAVSASGTPAGRIAMPM